MSFQDLVATAEAFAAKVASDPSRYASALSSGLAAIDNARAVVAKLQAHADSASPLVPPVGEPPAPPLVRELEQWAALAQTLEAEAGIDKEIELDRDGVTRDEVAQAIGTFVKLVAIAGKVL